MPEIMFNGPAGRLEGRCRPSPVRSAPVVVVLHPHPQLGGNMNHRVVYDLFYTFARHDFSVLRFNFRGVGRSQGVFDNGLGELSDAAAALDWIQTHSPEARECWIAGFSFGAWIAMQLLMRRPEIKNFVSISPPAGLYDFSFLAPCPSSGLVIHGGKDTTIHASSVKSLVDRLKTQKHIVIEYQTVAGSNHSFENYTEELKERVGAYIEARVRKA